MATVHTSPEEPKTEQVKSRIRSGIVTGRYRPDHRLPTFAEMEGDFVVGRAVIQRAVEALKRDGFIRSEGRNGLFVTENPPHLFQYGLVMPFSPGDAGWEQLMSALHSEAHRLEKLDTHRRFCFYHGIMEGEASAKHMPRLEDDLAEHRLAGLIIHHQSVKQVETLLGEYRQFPRVYLWADQTSGVSPCLTVDGPQLMERALHLLKAKGRQRIAVLQMGGTNRHLDHKAMFAQVGLRYHAPWMQWVGRSDPAYAENIVSLLMDYPADQRPDGLVIADDNLVTPVSSGLVAAGIRVSLDLDVVAHCNWPWLAPSVLPMARIGFDVREVLRRAIQMIDQQQQGIPLATYQRVPAVFENEIEPI